MSIVLGGHEAVDKQHDQEIDQKTKRKRNRAGDVHGILFKGVKETTVQRKRGERSYEKVQLEGESFSTRKKPRVKSFDRMPSFLYKPAYQDYQKVDHREGVDDVVEGVHRAHAEQPSVYVGRCNEKLSIVKLQDDDDVQKHKEHRPEHDRNKPNAQSLEEILISFYVRKPKDVVKRRRANVIPVGVPVQVHSAKKKHQEHEHGPVKGHDGGDHREKGGISPQVREHLAGDCEKSVIFSLDFLNHWGGSNERMLWTCPFADCPDPHHQHTQYAIKRHYLICHLTRLTKPEAKQALFGEFYVGGVKKYECVGCLKMFNQKSSLEHHLRRPCL